MSAPARFHPDTWTDEAVLYAVSNRLDTAWLLLGEFYKRVDEGVDNSLDKSRIRDLLRRIMDAKMEVDIIKIRVQNRAERPPAVPSGVHDAA